VLKSIAKEYLETKTIISRFASDDEKSDYVFGLNAELSAMHEQMCDILKIKHDGSIGGFDLAKSILRGEYD
jgi:hypothetical protein